MSEVGNASRREVGRGDGEVLKRSMELNGTGWGDAGQREVGRGDGEVLERFVELSDAGRSLEVNDETGEAEFVSITGDGWGADGEENGKTFSTNLI